MSQSSWHLRFTSFQDEPSLKLMRSLKSMRALRLVRTFRFVRGLRLLVTACKCFLPSLFWSMAPWSRGHSARSDGERRGRRRPRGPVRRVTWRGARGIGTKHGMVSLGPHHDGGNCMTPTQAVVGGYVWDPESCFRGTSADGFVYFRMPHRPVSEVLLAVFMIMGALTLGTTLQTFVADPATELEEKIWVWTRYGTAFRALYTMYEVGLVQLSSMRQCCIFTRVPEGLWTKPLGDTAFRALVLEGTHV